MTTKRGNKYVQYGNSRVEIRRWVEIHCKDPLGETKNKNKQEQGGRGGGGGVERILWRPLYKKMDSQWLANGSEDKKSETAILCGTNTTGEWKMIRRHNKETNIINIWKEKRGEKNPPHPRPQSLQSI